MDYVKDKQEILEIIQVLRPDFSLADINQNWIDFAEVKVNADLEDFGIVAPATDYNNFLKYASVCFYLEHSASKGQIQSHFGDVKSRQMGGVKTEFDPKSPMFFFARGTARGFYALLPHETWLMSARQLIRAYISKHYYMQTGKRSITGKIKHDVSTRGYGWDTRHEDYIDNEGYWG